MRALLGIDAAWTLSRPSGVALVAKKGPRVEAGCFRNRQNGAADHIELTRLARAAAPASVSRGAGTIVNISSIVAINPELLNGVDGGGNAIVLAFPHRLTMGSPARDPRPGDPAGPQRGLHLCEIRPMS